MVELEVSLLSFRGMSQDPCDRVVLAMKITVASHHIEEDPDGNRRVQRQNSDHFACAKIFRISDVKCAFRGGQGRTESTIYSSRHALPMRLSSVPAGTYKCGTHEVEGVQNSLSSFVSEKHA